MTQKPYVFRFVLLTGVATLAVLLIGCRTRPPAPGAQPPVHTDKWTPPPTDYPYTKPEPGGPASAEAAVRKLDVTVTATATGEGSDVVKRDLIEAVEGGLAARGFTVRPSAGGDVTPDLAVSMQARLYEFDRLGDFYVYKGDVTASALRSFDRKLLGEKQFSIKGQRTLDKRPALQAVSRELASQVTAWLTETCTTAMSNLFAQDVTVSGGRWKDKDKSSERADYARKFVEVVKGLPGIVSCEILNPYDPGKDLVFKVVYYKDQVPEGLLNRILTREELKLKKVEIKPGT